MFAVYAFCREVDDIADSDDAPDAKLAALAVWRARDRRALRRHAAPAARTRAGATVIRTYDLRRADFIAIIDGMEMDAAQDIRAPTLAELDLYCDRVASAVGPAFGADLRRRPRTRRDRVANALGRALQLTNILRDLAEDAARGRLYLPSELLDKHGIAERAPSAVLAPSAPCPRCAKRSPPWPAAAFAEAGAAMTHCPRRPMRPGGGDGRGLCTTSLARAAQSAAGGASTSRVSVPAPVKLWLRAALRAAMSGSRRVHVVGAGLAGLAASVRLADAGIAGFAPRIGARMPAAAAAPITTRRSAAASTTAIICCSPATARRMAYLERIGARDDADRPGRAGLSVSRPRYRRALGVAAESAAGCRGGSLRAARRVPGTRPDGLSRMRSRLLRAGPDATVAEVLDADSAIYRRLWRPLAIAALNTALGSRPRPPCWRACCARRFGAGGAACRPLVPRDGAVGDRWSIRRSRFLKARGAEIRFDARLRAIDFEGARASALDFDAGATAVAPGEERGAGGAGAGGGAAVAGDRRAR